MINVIILYYISN